MCFQCCCLEFVRWDEVFDQGQRCGNCSIPRSDANADEQENNEDREVEALERNRVLVCDKCYASYECDNKTRNYGRFQLDTPNVELTGAARLYRAASSD